MRVEFDDLDILTEIQRLDLGIMQAKKKRVELPQRIEVMRLLKKRSEIQDKLDQVLELRRAAVAEMTVLEDEDRALAEKQERTQELVDAAGADYRKVEAHTKDMAAAAKRREELSGRMLPVQEKIDKIKSIVGQLEGAIALTQSEEARLRASFEEEDNALIGAIKLNTARRNELEAKLPPELVSLYEKTAEKAGGVALGKLEENRCGVCRSLIEGGRLIELRASAPLGECPNCKRLLIVED